MNWGKRLGLLAMFSFTASGVGEPIHEVTGIARWICNLAGFAFAVWVFTVMGKVE